MDKIWDHLLPIILTIILIFSGAVALLLYLPYLLLRHIWRLAGNDAFIRRVEILGALVLVATLVFTAKQAYYTGKQADSMTKEADILIKQMDLLANQTALLGNQTQLQFSDYLRRNRPYLRLTGITVQEGSSNEVLDIVLELQNAGQVPATKTWLGEREGGEVGIYIGAQDLNYNEVTGKFTATNPTGLCMPSLSVETTNVPESTPVQKSSGTSVDITITVQPCWLSAINKTGAPEDQIFYPDVPGNQIITVNKSSYDEAMRILDAAHIYSMQLGLKYYAEGREYYYIATLQKLTDTKWIVKPIEKGN